MLKFSYNNYMNFNFEDVINNISKMYSHYNSKIIPYFESILKFKSNLNYEKDNKTNKNYNFELIDNNTNLDFNFRLDFTFMKGFMLLIDKFQEFKIPKDDKNFLVF